MSEPSNHRPARLLSATQEAAALIFVLAVAGFCAFIPINTGDIWWHVAVGRWILDSGQLPDADIWSAEPGTWHSFSWLYQIVVAKLDAAWGMAGIRAMSALWMLLTFGLCFILSRRAGASPWLAMLLAILLILGFQYRIRIRPHLFNLTAFLILTYTLFRLRPRLWLIPFAGLFMVLWSAVHAGGAMVAIGGLVVLLGTSLFVGVAERRNRAVAMAIALSALIGWILTPGALQTVMVVAGDQGATIAEIGEWSSYWAVLTEFGNADLHRWAMLALWPVAVFFWFRSLVRHRGQLRSPHLLHLVLGAYFLAISLVWFRLFFLTPLSLVLTVLAPKHVDPDKHEGDRPRPLSTVVTVVLALISAALVLQHATVGRYGSVSDSLAARSQVVEPNRFPTLPTRLLVDAEISARVALPEAWGGFVLYHGWPNLTVTMDGRNAASDEVMTTSAEIQHLMETGGDRTRLPALYTKLPADVLMMPHPAFLGAEDTGEWVFFGTSNNADLYFRSSPQLEEWWPQLVRAAQEQLSDR